jgi:hypothetical protein
VTPDADPRAARQVTWLVVDSRRLTYREYRRLAPGWGSFLVASVLKLVRIRVHFPSALPREFEWLDREDTTPAWAAARFAAEEPALIAAGLRAAGTYTIPSLGATATIGRVFLDADGLLVAQLMAAHAGGPQPVTRVHASCTSLVDDDSLVATGNLTEHLDHPPRVRGELVRGDAAAVVARHRARIAGVTVVPCPRDGVRARLASEHALEVAFNERRRVYVPIEPAQLTTLRAVTLVDPLPTARVVDR